MTLSKSALIWRTFERTSRQSQNLTERSEVLPFFRSHPNLAAFIADYHPGILKLNRSIAFEYQLFGDFGADLVLGDPLTSTFCFVEFEDASAESVFKVTGRSIPAWAPRFLAGLGQVIDWFWKLSEYQHTPDFIRKFGNRPVDFEGILVIGRSAGMADRERQRLLWLTRNCVVNSKHVRFLTLDDIYRDLSDRYQAYMAVL